MTRRIFLVPISSFEPFLKVKDAGCLKSVRRLLFYKKSWRQWRDQLCRNLLFDPVWKMFLIFAEKSWLAHIQESGCLVSGAALFHSTFDQISFHSFPGLSIGGKRCFDGG